MLRCTIYKSDAHGCCFTLQYLQGIPLSQYDLAEVLLGFSAVTVLVLQQDFGFGTFPFRQRQDMYHCWRYIGWHLGILDEFNVCASTENLERDLDEYLVWTKLRLLTCRQSTHELQSSTCEAFGKYTGIGTQWYRAMVVYLQTVRAWNVRYSDITARPCLDKVVRTS